MYLLLYSCTSYHAASHPCTPVQNGKIDDDREFVFYVVIVNVAYLVSSFSDMNVMIFKIRECSLPGLTTVPACVRVTVASGCVYTLTARTGQVDTRHQAGPWPRVVTGAHSGHSQSGADTGTTVTHRDNNKDNRRHPH